MQIYNEFSRNPNKFNIFFVPSEGLKPSTFSLGRNRTFNCAMRALFQFYICVAPMGLEPIITQLKRLVLYQFSYKANPCASIGNRTRTP